MIFLTGSEMQAADRVAIKEMGIPSLQLMERAGEGVARVVDDLAGEDERPVIMVCGKGNNGGDGFVVARLLAGLGRSIEVWLAADAGQLTGDAETNWKRLHEEGPALPGEISLFPIGTGPVDSRALMERWRGGAVLVDALFGTGMVGPPRDPGASLIAAMNLTGCGIVAVDIPSGVNADSGVVAGEAVLADVTVTMAFPKQGLLLHPGREHAGRIEVVDIGIPEEAVGEREFDRTVIDHQWAVLRLPARPADSHKGTYGRVLAIAGSAEMMGAARLLCAAAARAGAGLVRHAAPASLLGIAHTGRSEVVVTPLPDKGTGIFVPEGLDLLQQARGWADVMVIGPGIGTARGTGQFFAGAIDGDDPELPLVIDADGLNLLAAEPELRKRWAGPVVITPHPGEAARLLGSDTGAIAHDRIGAAVELAVRYGAIAVLKGAPTIIASGEGEVALCPLGNPGMASGGTGDVLTGVIAGLIGQGLSPWTGATLGVYLHSLAADLAALDLGMWSLLAGDILDYLPVAFGHLEAFPELDVLAEGVWI
ncbi:NAD(P)H-hydrate dehydratase [Gemmatimonadota bacterium]